MSISRAHLWSAIVLTCLAIGAANAQQCEPGDVACFCKNMLPDLYAVPGDNRHYYDCALTELRECPNKQVFDNVRRICVPMDHMLKMDDSPYHLASPVGAAASPALFPSSATPPSTYRSTHGRVLQTTPPADSYSYSDYSYSPIFASPTTVPPSPPSFSSPTPGVSPTTPTPTPTPSPTPGGSTTHSCTFPFFGGFSFFFFYPIFPTCGCFNPCFNPCYTCTLTCTQQGTPTPTPTPTPSPVPPTPTTPPAGLSPSFSPSLSPTFSPSPFSPGASPGASPGVSPGASPRSPGASPGANPTPLPSPGSPILLSPTRASSPPM